MRIETRDFGLMTIDAAEVIHFCQPIFGFEQQRDFVLLYDDSVGTGFIWLQAVAQSEVCFIVLTPDMLPCHYSPALPQEVVQQLGLAQAQDAIIGAVAVIPEDITKATVNLKSPIIINPHNRKAAQVMLEEDYLIRMPLVETEEAAPC